jgi:CDGSH-type Zn-finger protein
MSPLIIRSLAFQSIHVLLFRKRNFTRYTLPCHLHMARLVRKEASAPMPVKVGNEIKWVCMCRLSNNQPLRDGSHKKTADEEIGKI